MSLSAVLVHDAGQSIRGQRTRSYDPTGCYVPRRKMDAVMRRSVNTWRSSLHDLIVKQDALGVKHSSVLSWPADERLQRFTSFAREAGKKATTVQSEVARILRGAHARGYWKAYWERGREQPVFLPQPSRIYEQVVMNGVLGASEAAMSGMSLAVSKGITIGDRSTKMYSRVLAVLQKTALVRMQVGGHTVITQAFNHGKIRAYRELGVGHVRIIPETTRTHAHSHKLLGISDAPQTSILTAGDDLVCPECEGLEGQIYTVDKAESLIPVHPNCRCEVVYEDSSPDGILTTALLTVAAIAGGSLLSEAEGEEISADLLEQIRAEGEDDEEED